MWDWFKKIFLPRGGVAGIKLFNTLTLGLFKTKGKGGK